MYSPAKKTDKETLLIVGDMIKMLALGGKADIALELGEWYTELEDKIKTHNYTEDDKAYESS